MKYVIYFIYIVVAVIFISVAVNNAQSVNVVVTPEWLPFIGGINYTAPLFVTLFGALFIGIAFGLMFEYIREMRIRSRGRRAEKQLKKTQKELDKVKKKTGEHADDVLALVE